MAIVNRPFLADHLTQIDPEEPKVAQWTTAPAGKAVALTTTRRAFSIN
jgi:hypothetical protein